MNETQIIFYSIFAFGLGYGAAYFFKNMGRLWKQWGILAWILFPLIIFELLIGGAVLSGFRKLSISIAFAVGFFIRLFKK